MAFALHGSESSFLKVYIKVELMYIGIPKRISLCFTSLLPTLSCG